MTPVPAVFRDRAFIDGEWVGSADFAVTDKATADVIGRVPDLGQRDARAAIEAASRAFPQWSRRLAKERSALLRRWVDLIREHADDLASLLTLEQGKPLAEARSEIEYGASFVEFFAEEAKRVYGETIPSFKPGARVVVLKQPIGVVAAITPWNFPNAMITRKVAPALAVGCTVVVKPAEETPLSALALAGLAERAGFPKGVFNVLTTQNPEAVGEELTRNPTVRMVTFTGSTDVGKILMRQASETVKRVGLELGGNAPFIVFEDADLDRAVQGAMASKFRNAGQTCVCANRILVQESVLEAFATRLANAASKLRVGPGLDAATQIGPLINEAAIAKVEEHIADAIGNGARVVLGGNRHSLGGTYFEPTVLVDVRPGMHMFAAETFGPVAGLVSFRTEDEAIALANDTPFGLAAYFYARDVGRCWRVAEALAAGVIGVNEGIVSSEVVPFGGVKQSGIGREGSHHGIEEFLEVKYVLMGGLAGAE